MLSKSLANTGDRLTPVLYRPWVRRGAAHEGGSAYVDDTHRRVI